MKNSRPKKTPSKDRLNKGFELAFEYQKKSYSPYSEKKIGAAILLADGTLYGGCNIENASYGATVCAERVAVWKAVSEKARIKISEVFVVSPKGSPPWPPCGMCRQVLSEFCTDKTLVHCSNPDGEVVSTEFGDIFPGAFRKDYLK